MKMNTNNTQLEITAGLPSQFPRKKIPQIAFSGRSNVGKSSLLNCLVNRKNLARTSSAPGKTITVNFYNIDEKLYFVDLPGYGYAKRSPQEKAKLSTLTDGYFTQDGSDGMLCTVMQLIDLKAGATSDDLTMINWLNQFSIPYVIIATKTDKLNKTEKEKNLAILKDIPLFDPKVQIIPFSAHTGEGKQEIWESVFDALQAFTAHKNKQ